MSNGVGSVINRRAAPWSHKNRGLSSNQGLSRPITSHERWKSSPGLGHRGSVKLKSEKWFRNRKQQIWYCRALMERLFITSDKWVTRKTLPYSRFVMVWGNHEHDPLCFKKCLDWIPTILCARHQNSSPTKRARWCILERVTCSLLNGGLS